MFKAATNCAINTEVCSRTTRNITSPVEKPKLTNQDLEEAERDALVNAWSSNEHRGRRRGLDKVDL